MTIISIQQIEDLNSELIFASSRSGGPGGQNVNKVNSKVTLKFGVTKSTLLTEEQKTVILNKLASRITKDGVLMIVAQDSRSQLENKQVAIAKFNELIKKAFTPKKARKPTKPTKASNTKRVDKKKQHSEKKKWRQKLD